VVSEATAQKTDAEVRRLVEMGELSKASDLQVGMKEGAQSFTQK
jgi:hypothetical protein